MQNKAPLQAVVVVGWVEAVPQVERPVEKRAAVQSKKISLLAESSSFASSGSGGMGGGSTTSGMASGEKAGVTK